MDESTRIARAFAMALDGNIDCARLRALSSRRLRQPEPAWNQSEWLQHKLMMRQPEGMASRPCHAVTRRDRRAAHKALYR